MNSFSSATRGSHTRRSCDRCHGQKLRCERDPDSTGCRRCQRANVTCTLTAPTRQGQGDVFISSKYSGELVTQGEQTLPQVPSRAQPSLDSETIAKAAPTIETAAETRPLSQQEYEGRPEIRWTYAGHLTFPIEYSAPQQVPSDDTADDGWPSSVNAPNGGDTLAGQDNAAGLDQTNKHQGEDAHTTQPRSFAATAWKVYR